MAKLEVECWYEIGNEFFVRITAYAKAANFVANDKFDLKVHSGKFVGKNELIKNLKIKYFTNKQGKRYVDFVIATLKEIEISASRQKLSLEDFIKNKYPQCNII